MTMTAKIRLSVLALLLGSLPAMATGQIAPNTSLGTNEAQIRASLKTMGATVEELDSGKGIIEVQYSIDGKSHEVRVDAASGKVVAIDAKGDDASGDE